MPRNARKSWGHEGKRRSRAATNATQGDQRQASGGEQAGGKQAEGKQAGGYLKPSRERAFWMAASVMLLPLSIWASSVMRSSGVS